MDKFAEISPSSFYKNSNVSKYIQNKGMDSSNVIIPYKMSNLISGPPLTWKVFKKQAEALHFISLHKFHLMAFAFESALTRLFLAAHPEVFWHYDSQRPPNCRCTYEIIPERTACKLYFDIEFNRELNSNKNGYQMVGNFIPVVIYYLKLKFKVECKLEHVLNLDSSTSEKFSCHLIFNIPGVCFADNKQAGNFVNFICDEVFGFTTKKALPEELNYLSLADISDMIVKDSKGNSSIFCDRSVYSRNRHFRLYKSTKYGKFAPLVLSQYNKFRPSTNSKDPEEDIFYASLITYLPNDFEGMKVLTFECSLNDKGVKDSVATEIFSNNSYENVSSPFSAVDNFIASIVSPGKIFRSCYFPSSRLICYNIIGNRFCGNIGRPHKRNNVKYIVDLQDGIYYQKCHDFDCANYKSEKKPIPGNILIACDLEDDSVLGSFDIPSKNSAQKHLLQRFPSCGLSDEDIVNHLNSSNDFDCGLSDEEIVNHLNSSNDFDF